MVLCSVVRFVHFSRRVAWCVLSSGCVLGPEAVNSGGSPGPGGGRYVLDCSSPNYIPVLSIGIQNKVSYVLDGSSPIYIPQMN